MALLKGGHSFSDMTHVDLCSDEKQIMSMLQLILEQPRPTGGKKRVSLHVRNDLPIGAFVSALVKQFHFPTSDSAGRPVIYRLYTVADGKLLPEHHSFVDLRVPSGTPVRLSADVLSSSHRSPASMPPGPVSPRGPSFPRMSRRAVLTTGILASCSLAGLLTGATTALAQRALSHPATAGASPAASPTRVAFAVQPQLSFTAHSAPVRAVTWSSDGTTLASGGDDATLLLWTRDGTIQNRMQYPEGVNALAWAPDGKRLAASTGANIIFVDTTTGKILGQPQQVHQNLVTSLTWSAFSGHPVISGSLDKRAVVWETEHYLPVRVFTRHTAPIEAVSSIAGGAATIASASEGGLIRVWRLDTLREEHGFYQDATVAMHAAAFAPKGNQLAVGGHDGIVRVWEDGQTCLHTIQAQDEQQCADAPQRWQAHTAPVRAVSWSADARYLATGSDDKKVVLWDVMTGFSQVTTIAHKAPVLAITWSPDGQFLAVATGNAVQIWKLQFGM
jgi:hypothetical protein